MSKSKIEEKEFIDPLFAVLDGLNKKHGSGTVLVGDEVVETEKLSSGSIALDIALGGGYGLGRIVELYGPESSGKTFLAINAAIQAQIKFPDKWIVIIDAEHAFDRTLAEMLGLDMKRVTINQPDNGEQGFEVLEKVVESGRVSLCIVDSVAAMTPKAEIEAGMDAQQMGLQARMMSKGLRIVTGKVERSKTVVVFINQLREKIGCNSKNNTVFWEKM